MKGFTLIELLIVIAIIVIIMTATLVALNPFRHFAQANDANRMAGINTILNAISQRMVDNRGCFFTPDETKPPGTITDCPCPNENIPSLKTIIGSGTDQYNFCNYLVPTYLAGLPVDPQYGSYRSCAEPYNTRYTISCSGGRITICAPQTQIGPEFCVSR